MILTRLRARLRSASPDMFPGLAVRFICRLEPKQNAASDIAPSGQSVALRDLDEQPRLLRDTRRIGFEQEQQAGHRRASAMR